MGKIASSTVWRVGCAPLEAEDLSAQQLADMAARVQELKQTVRAYVSRHGMVPHPAVLRGLMEGQT